MLRPPPTSTLFPYTTLFRSTAKTLVIGGTKDTGTTPAMAQSIAGSIPEAKLVMLEAAHLTNIELADEFNAALIDRKSTRLNSSHSQISYAVFCLKKKKNKKK